MDYGRNPDDNVLPLFSVYRTLRLSSPLCSFHAFAPLHLTPSIAERQDREPSESKKEKEKESKQHSSHIHNTADAKLMLSIFALLSFRAICPLGGNRKRPFCVSGLVFFSLFLSLFSFRTSSVALASAHIVLQCTHFTCRHVVSRA